MSKTGYNRTRTTPEGYVQQPDGRATLYNQTYVGFVKDNVDAIKMGRLKVWIPELSGDPLDEASWYTVNYCSPFAGASQIDYNIKGGHSWKESQTSYGFWAIPPDLENEVVIQFINGDPNRGIWIGCLYQQYMNHMVPGIPRNNDWQNSDEPPPVVEYNKWDNVGEEEDPRRPRFDPLYEGLKKQGLLKDHERGPSSSGARRESPSKVFGMLTPRGQQFVMDDLECNEFIRLRTRSGVQVLIHETNGYVYMCSKKGNSWLQISDDGIEMYSSKPVNIRSSTGVNYHTDSDFNLFVGGNFNTFVSGDYQLSVKGNSSILTGGDSLHDIAGSSHQTIKGNRIKKIEGLDSLDVSGKLILNSNGELSLKSENYINAVGKRINLNSGSTSKPIPPVPAYGKEPKQKSDTLLEEEYPSDQTYSNNEKLPSHEPYYEHPGGDQSKKPDIPLPSNDLLQNDTIAPLVIPSNELEGLNKTENNLKQSMGIIQNGGNKGSAILIDNSGTMLTSSAILGENIQLNQEVKIQINDSTRIATISSIDPERGIATLKLLDTNNLTPINIGTAPTTGEEIYSYGWSNNDNYTKLSGTFNGQIDQTFNDGNVSIDGLNQFYSDKTLEPGMIGGPVLNKNGEVVGLNIGSVSNESKNYYIPLS